MHATTIARWGISFVLLIAFILAHGQDVEQKSLNVDGKSVSYHVIRPAGDVTGILLLFPGKGESPKSVFKKTSLPEKLSSKGYTTIVPNLKYALFADELIRKQVGEILRAETEGHPAASVAIGGFSAGGTVALSYAEYLISEGNANFRSVFVIDAPLDLQRLYATSRKLRKYNCPEIHAGAEQTISYLNQQLGGTPDEQYSNYTAFSPYIANEDDGGNARWLRQVPVRLYADLDIEFVQERHCAEMELQDLNSVDLERLYKHLRKAGNDRCELISTKGRGDHTWNIADADELSAWIGKF